MKRFMAFLLVLCMSLANVTVLATEKTLTQTDITKEAGLLKSIGIINSIPENSEGNSSISRADFVWYAAKTMRIQKSEQISRYFLDVPMDHWAVSDINAMTEMNIISLPQDKLFRPNDRITENEALKILISILGYSDYARISGGYPLGYSEIASRLEFTYTGSDKYITLYQALVMIYETLNSCVYEKTVEGNGYVGYEESDETLLSKNFDIYSIDGIVMQSNGVSLSGEPIKGKTSNQTSRIVRIDKEEYTSDINLYDYLGRYVTVYYIQEDEDDMPHIIYKEEHKKEAEIIEINEEDFVGYKDDVISYYDENSRLKTVDIPAGAVIVKNGMLKNSNNQDELNLSKGIIRLIDADDDNSIDYVFIYEYKNIFVEVIDADEEKIYDAVVSGRYISLDSDEKIVTVENSSGQTLDFSAIKKGQLLTVYDSETYTRVIINSDSVSAKIYANSEEDGKFKVEIGKSEQDRKWYEIDDEYYNEYIKGNEFNGHEADIDLKPGSEISYWRDAFGKIAYISGPNDASWSFCYLISVNYDEDNEQTKLKVFMESGALEVVTVDKKVILDGTIVKTNDEIKAGLDKVSKYGKTLETDEDRINGQLIRIKKNNNGMVSGIDSEYNDTEKEDRISLKRSQDYGKWLFWYHANGFVENGNAQSGKQMFYNGKTVRFIVPKHSDLKNATEDDFGLMSGYYEGSGGLFYVEGFKLDLESGHESVIVNYQDNASLETAGPYLIESVSKAVSADGDVVLVANVYTASGGDKVTVEAKDDGAFNFTKSVKMLDGTVKEYTDSIAKGDFIMASVDHSGKVVSVTVYYDYSVEKDAKQSLGWKKGSASQSDNTFLVSAYVKNINDGIAYLWYEDHLDADDLTGSRKNLYNHAARVQTGTALVFDGKNIRKSTLAEELIGASSLGYEDARPYFLTTRYTKITSAVLYKDYE